MKKTSSYALISVLILMALSALGLQACANLGGSHSQSDKQRYALSKQYDAKEQRFVSPNQASIDAMKDKVFNLKNIYEQLGKGKHLTPDEKLPEHRIDMAAFLDDQTSPNIIWLGHSSYLIRIAQKTILIDPVFENAGPIFFMANRFQPAILARTDLPPVDYVLISHDHYDHLEAATIKHLAANKSHFIVPIGVGTHLRQWGIPQERLTEKDWWDEVQLDNLLIALVPSEHYSGRKAFLANDTLWASFVIKSAKTNLYFSGDSGYGDHFATIGQRYGPFDLAFLENGQYHPVSRKIHMHPEDTIKAFKDLNANILVPMHWAMFALARHAWYDPAEQITDLAHKNGLKLYVPHIGEMITNQTNYDLKHWWQPIMKRQQAKTE